MTPVGRTIQPGELAAFSSEIPGVEEKRRWALYDNATFAAAATVTGDVNMFTTPIGQGATPKTLRDTNMRQAGQLPARQGMEVWDIRVQPELTLVNADTSVVVLNSFYTAFNALLYGASFTFRQAQKVDLEISPLAILSAGYGATVAAWGGADVTAAATAGAGAAILNNGHPSRMALWDLDPLPIVILPQRSFQITINFPTAVVLPAGVGLVLWVHLDGILHRSA